MSFTMTLKGKTYTVETLAAASKLYCELRDESGLGSSQWPDAEVLDADGKPAARISYNGRVWSPEPWEWRKSTPIMEAQG